jgi:hypothetical protein
MNEIESPVHGASEIELVGQDVGHPIDMKISIAQRALEIMGDLVIAQP